MGYRGYGLPVTDLISEGNVGIMQAVKKFDPEKGFRLATYAMWWIRAQIQEYVLHSWSLVKIGTTAAQKKLFFNLRKLKNQLTSINSPVVGDAIYGKNKISKYGLDKKNFNKFLILKNFSRQALHATHLGFFHPTLKKNVEFNSKIPEDISNLIKFLVKY